MLFNNTFIKESSDQQSVNDIDILSGEANPETEEGMEAIAQEVETNMQTAALESMTYFSGGEDAQKAYMESAEVQALVEAKRMVKKTFVRLNKNDDMTRRAHLASLILARNNKDPLFNKLALNRVKERKLRNAIFTKYKNKAEIIARKSQKQHIKNSKTLPIIRF
jgi:hypothetical protein